MHLRAFHGRALKLSLCVLLVFSRLAAFQSFKLILISSVQITVRNGLAFLIIYLFIFGQYLIFLSFLWALEVVYAFLHFFFCSPRFLSSNKYGIICLFVSFLYLAACLVLSSPSRLILTLFFLFFSVTLLAVLKHWFVCLWCSCFPSDVFIFIYLNVQTERSLFDLHWELHWTPDLWPQLPND